MSTAFSYAQAARGQTSAQPPAPQSVASQAASTTSSQSRDAATTSTTSASASAASAAPSTTSNDVDANDITPKPSSQPESLSKGEAETDTYQSKEEDLSQKAALSATASPLPIEDTKKQAMENPTQGTERRLKAPTASTRTSDVSDNKKSRKGKKSKGAEKDSEQDPAEKEKEAEAPKVQLSEAPIPAVNIWQLRAKEAQQKVTPSPALRPTANSSNNLAPSTSDPKPKPSSSGIENSTTQNRPTSNGLKSQKKGNDSTRENNEHAPRRTAARGNRAGEKADKSEKAVYESLPSVADVSSWPTPVSAATEVKAPEKVEKPDEKEEPKEELKQDANHKGKTNWVQLPYVPSPSFQTQFQTRSGRGGRAGGQRGGRENGTRGGHTGASNSVDKSQATTSAKASSGTQERANENTSSGKAASLPHAAKRGSVDNTMSKDMRKASAGTNTEAAKPSAKSPTVRNLDYSLNDLLNTNVICVTDERDC
jgi:la-related protein 1